MCTNYVTTVRDEIRDRLDLQPPTFDYRTELWPGYKGPMLVGDFEWRHAVFGLIPYFSKDGKDFRRTYNARSETVDSRPSYRSPWRRRQNALIPMSAFFEPNYESGRPVRWRIERHDQWPFTVAAIWDTWRGPEGDLVHSFSLLTINADGHPVMGRFHPPADEKRSLVVVPADRRQDWLTTAEAQVFLVPMPPDEFTSAPAPLPAKVTAAKKPAAPDLFTAGD